VIGTGVWLAFLSSGVHATLASVLMAMTIPARTRIDGQRLVAAVGGLLSDVDGIAQRPSVSLLSSKQQQALQQIRRLIQDASAPLQELEHDLVPLVTFLVLPLFALANAGVPLDAGFLASLRNPVSLGIIAGLFVGKQLGIVGACFIAIKLGIAEMPREVRWRDLHAVAILGGIGFTMSLFVAGLAFKNPAYQESARVGILFASTMSALVGGLLLRRSQSPAAAKARVLDARQSLGHPTSS
jgi:NhaA family Na+:H+ antiporter